MSDAVSNPEAERLEARVVYLTNVNQKLCVMIKNAADILDQYAETLDLLLVEIRRTKKVYSKLHEDLTEAFGEHSSTANPTSS